MNVAIDVTDKNGMKHDDKGLFSGYSGTAHHELSPLEQAIANLSGGHSHSHESPSQSHHHTTYHMEHHGNGHGHGSWHGGVNASSTPQSAHSVFRIPNVKTNGPAKQPWRYADSKGKQHDRRVDRITDRPVSAEMEDAINRLYRGEEISLSDIEAIPEMQREQKLADAYCALDKIMHPEDYENKDETLNAVYQQFSGDTITHDTNESLQDGESYKVTQGHEIWLVTGLPGSGKSTSFVGPISKANQARVVDSDAIKERMPGFCHGLGAPNVHEQSKSINDRILAESLKRGDNIVYPVLGYNPSYVGDQIDSFRRKGYKVHLILNELPFSQSLARCLERRLATGRNIPLAMFKKVGDRPSQAYESLKKKVDTYEKHTGDGISTKKVESGENKNLPPPQHNTTYSYHGMPLHGYATYEQDKHGNTHFSSPHDQPHVSHLASEFGVPPQSKPKYHHKTWLEGFSSSHHGHDCMNGMDGADVEENTNIVEIDRFGNVLLRPTAQYARKRALDGDTSVPDDQWNRYSYVAIPDAFDGEIGGSETAKDLARFHYIAYDCDCE